MNRAKYLVKFLEDTMGWLSPDSVNYFPANTDYNGKKSTNIKKLKWRKKKRPSR